MVTSRSLLCLFDCITGWKSHDETIDQNRHDNEETEHRMNQHVNCDTADGMERIQQIHRFAGMEPENIFAFAYYNKSLREEGMKKRKNEQPS
jgi:hypothetical protein